MKNTQKTITRTIEGKHITVARIVIVDNAPPAIHRHYYAD